MPDLNHEAPGASVPRALGMSVVGLLLGLAFWRALSFGTPYGGDWAQYMAHAAAIVDGRPYGDIGYLFSPYAWQFGPAIYPPGLPLALSPSVALFGSSLVLPRLLMHGFLALFLAAVYRYFARDQEQTIALGSVALLGTSFLLAGTANVVGSDLGMCAFVWCALLLAETEDPWTWRRTLLIAFLGATAMTFRVAAAPLIPAVGLWAVLRRGSVRWRPWLVVACATVALVLVMMAFGPGEQATEAASRRLVGPAGEPMPGLARWWGRTLSRLHTYRFALSASYLYPFPGALGNRLYHVLAVPVMLVGIAGWVRRDWTRLGVIFGVGTLAMLFVLPVWAGRYAWVVMPFASFGLVRGFALGLKRFRRLPADRAARGAVVGVLVVALLAIATSGGRPSGGVADDAADWRAMGISLHEWAEGSALRSVSNRPRVLTWHTGIPAAGVPSEAFEVFLDETARLGITTVVVSNTRPEEPAYHRWLGWMSEHRDVFKEVAVIGDLEAYEILRPTEP